MKISDILVEQTPQGTVSHNRPKVLSPLNKQVRDAGQQMLNKADDAAEVRIGPGDQDMAVGAEEKFNRSMGGMMKKIGSGNMNKITDKQLQSATVAGKELQGQLNKAVASVGKPKAKPTTQDLQSK